MGEIKRIFEMGKNVSEMVRRAVIFVISER